jgi:hypothetical protein
MMETGILNRRCVLQLVALGSLAVPVMALVGCSTGGGRIFLWPGAYTFADLPP